MLDSGSKRTETYTILRASLSTTGAESPSVRLSRCSPLSLAKTIFWAGYCVINCKLVGLYLFQIWIFNSQDGGRVVTYLKTVCRRSRPFLARGRKRNAAAGRLGWAAARSKRKADIRPWGLGSWVFAPALAAPHQNLFGTRTVGRRVNWNTPRDSINFAQRLPDGGIQPQAANSLPFLHGLSLRKVAERERVHLEPLKKAAAKKFANDFVRARRWLQRNDDPP